MSSTGRHEDHPKVLVAYEVVNREDPSLVDVIDLGGDHDYDGRVLDGLLRQMNVEDWFVRNVYSDGSRS